jgi:RNA polymerase sigma-70 factor (TIGR02960 family)
MLLSSAEQHMPWVEKRESGPWSRVGRPLQQDSRRAEAQPATAPAVGDAGESRAVAWVVRSSTGWRPVMRTRRFVGKDDVVEDRLEAGERSCPVHVGGGGGVLGERHEVLGASPARVDSDFAPVEAAVDPGGEVSRLLAYDVVGRPGKQVDEGLLALGFDGEDVDQRHGLWLAGVCHLVLGFGRCLRVVTPVETGTDRARSVSGRRGVITGKVSLEMTGAHEAVAEGRALSRARAGDGDAFGQLTEPYRGELRAHCYRLLGSVHDAEDVLQETMLAAWRGLEGFEGRSSLRTWLYRIATNRSLNARRSRSRRRELPAMPAPPAPTRTAEPLWLQPYPDALLEGVPDRAPNPETRYEARESMELAFVTALQRLPPRQRAALVLRDVLGFRVTEVATMLDAGEASVKSALQRARATLARRLERGARDPAPRADSEAERRLVQRLADAIEAGDLASVVELLTDDAWLTMPPQPYAYQGRTAIASFLRQRFETQERPLRAVATRSNTQPALGCYFAGPSDDAARPYGLLVLTLAGSQLSALTWFADTTEFESFGLPPVLPVPNRATTGVAPEEPVIRG